jgi:O-antigen/teichoic acid export membrane protein
MLGGVVVIAASLFATEFLPVLIRSGMDSAVVFVFLTCILGLLIFGATNFVSAGLFYERKVHLIPFAYYGVALLKFIGNLLLIPLWGIAGATLSAFLSYLALPVAVYAISKKYFAFRIEWARLGAFIAIMAPSFLYGYYSAFYSPVSIYLRLAGLIITLLLIYRICLSTTERLSITALLKQLTPKSDLACPKP